MVTIETLLHEMVTQRASDLYLTFGSPAVLRVGDDMISLGDSPLSDDDITRVMDQLLSDDQRDEFQSTLELNIGYECVSSTNPSGHCYSAYSNGNSQIGRTESSVCLW